MDREEGRQRTELVTTGYAFLLADYIETFRPDPGSLSWRDFEIYQVFVKTRQAYLSENGKKRWK